MKKKQSEQKIEIYFNFIGNYELPQAELSEEEKQKLEEEERNYVFNQKDYFSHIFLCLWDKIPYIF